MRPRIVPRASCAAPGTSATVNPIRPAIRTACNFMRISCLFGNLSPYSRGLMRDKLPVSAVLDIYVERADAEHRLISELYVGEGRQDGCRAAEADFHIAVRH